MPKFIRDGDDSKGLMPHVSISSQNSCGKTNYLPAYQSSISSNEAPVSPKYSSKLLLSVDQSLSSVWRR